MKPTYPRLPDAELEVMKALWALGDCPAHTGTSPKSWTRAGRPPRC